MFGLMMDIPLQISRLLDYAAEYHSETEIVGLNINGRAERTNYAGLRKRAARLANAVSDQGYGFESKHASLSWNTINHLEVFYASLGVGASLHTVNPRLSEEHIVYMINQVEDELVFVDQTTLPIAESIQNLVPCVKMWVYLDEGEGLPESSLSPFVRKSDFVSEYSEAIVWPLFDERQASVIGYTSGTTGMPKGVVQSHRGNVLSAMGMSMADGFGGYQNGALDVVMPIAPFFHTNGWQMPFTAPMNGFKLVLPGRDFSPVNLTNLIGSEGVTIAGAVPTVWMDILDIAEKGNLDLSSLRVALVAGSRPSMSLLDNFEKNGIDALQMWGMTEAIASTKGTLSPGADQLPAEEQRQKRLRSQGRTSFLVKFELRDENNKRLPNDGESQGNMFVRGDFVASRYLGQDETQEVDWMDTGDISRIEPDGAIEIVDRSKDAIKSGGEWISTPLLEGAAISHEAIEQAAAIAMPHPRWQERPLLLCTLVNGATCSKEDLLGHMRERVAKWWLPDEIIFIETMPLTSIGKIDKVAIRKIYLGKDSKIIPDS
ncbi:MAG: AMP-binding protein [Pseudomonadales bacterium]|nr:AMP-binding protein [Pseudomonadales bacterium]